LCGADIYKYTSNTIYALKLLHRIMVDKLSKWLNYTESTFISCNHTLPSVYLSQYFLTSIIIAFSINIEICLSSIEIWYDDDIKKLSRYWYIFSIYCTPLATGSYKQIRNSCMKPDFIMSICPLIEIVVP